MKWEYKTISLNNAHACADELMQAGQDGWELVQVTVIGVTGGIAWFKRPIVQDSAKRK